MLVPYPFLVPLTFLVSQTFSAFLEEKDIRNVCERPWILVYAHSPEGNAWIGSKKKLMDDVVAGKAIKVTLLEETGIYQVRVDNVNRRKEEVCVESLGHLAHNGTHIDDVSPRRYMLLCSSGHATVLEMSGERGKRRHAMYWYTQDLSERSLPVYSHYIDGTPARGSLDHLWLAARTMALRGVMRDRGYVFDMHNVAVDVHSGVVTGQSVRHIGQVISNGRTEFASPAYHWFSSWSSNGRRDNARWLLSQHVPKGHNSDLVALDWYADTCWRNVYQHDYTGYPEFGSVQGLIDSIRKGNRARVTIDDVMFEVSNVRISGEVVVAQLLNNVVRAGWTAPAKYDIQRDTAYHWVLAHTTGTLRSYEYPVGSSTSKSKEDFKAMMWSVDTRPWRVVLRTADQGRVMEGSPSLLVKVLEEGASIRINIGLDEKGGDFLTEPENVRIDETEKIVYAQAMSHVSDKKTSVQDEYAIQSSAFFWYLMISSDGVVRMSAWYVGKEERLYDDRAPSANVTWYANL